VIGAAGVRCSRRKNPASLPPFATPFRTAEEVVEQFAWEALKDSPATRVELGGISPDGTKLYFAANRQDSRGGVDIYRADIGISHIGDLGIAQRVQALLGKPVQAAPLALDDNIDTTFDSADITRSVIRKSQ
jgi:hypothetical protein